jgi:thymidylate synthase ThyX
MIEDIRLDPAMLVHWGRNQPGMQADVELSPEEMKLAKLEWRASMESVIGHVEKLIALGLHKQAANRLLEPYSHINVIVTATEWDNFFQLRDHREAQPEIRALAVKMREAMTDVYWDEKINLLEPGQWHLPYVRASEYEYSDVIKQKISAARCARVSYMTHEGKPSTVDEDVALYDKLIVMKPAHASPIEHQAMAHGLNSLGKYGRYANFVGWQSLRNQMEQRGEL